MGWRSITCSQSFVTWQAADKLPVHSLTLRQAQGEDAGIKLLNLFLSLSKEGCAVYRVRPAPWRSTASAAWV